MIVGSLCADFKCKKCSQDKNTCNDCLYPGAELTDCTTCQTGKAMDNILRVCMCEK